MSEWISVDDDKKPDINGMVLCYGFTGENLDNPHEKDYDMGVMTTNGFIFYAQCMGTVTHWMSLPEPPKAGE